jgi:hypothetical protein
LAPRGTLAKGRWGNGYLREDYLDNEEGIEKKYGNFIVNSVGPIRKASYAKLNFLPRYNASSYCVILAGW